MKHVEYYFNEEVGKKKKLILSWQAKLGELKAELVRLEKELVYVLSVSARNSFIQILHTLSSSLLLPYKFSDSISRDWSIKAIIILYTLQIPKNGESNLLQFNLLQIPPQSPISAAATPI